MTFPFGEIPRETPEDHDPISNGISYAHSIRTSIYHLSLLYEEMMYSSEVQGLVGVPTTCIYKNGTKIKEFTGVDDTPIHSLFDKHADKL